MLKKKLLQSLNIVKFVCGSCKPIAGPLKVQVELTNSCNSRCVTCGFWKQDVNKEVSTEEWIKVIDDIATMNVLRLSFTGGEPFLRKDIFQLVKYAKGKGLKVNVNTNGMLLNNHIKQICDSGIDSMAISLDSANPKVHDKNRGVEGAFNKTMEGVKKLLDCNERPVVQFNMTLNKHNLDEMMPMIDYCNEVKIDALTFEPAHSVNEFWNCPEELKITNKETKKLGDDIDAALKKGVGLVLPPYEYYRLFTNFYEDPEYFRRFRYSAGYTVITIDPFGNVYESPLKDKLGGNIGEDSLIKIFFGKKFNQIRHEIKKGDHTIYWLNSTGPFDLLAYYLKTMRIFSLIKMMSVKRY